MCRIRRHWAGDPWDIPEKDRREQEDDKVFSKAFWELFGSFSLMDYGDKELAGHRWLEKQNRQHV